MVLNKRLDKLLLSTAVGAILFAGGSMTVYAVNPSDAEKKGQDPMVSKPEPKKTEDKSRVVAKSESAAKPDVNANKSNELASSADDKSVPDAKTQVNIAKQQSEVQQTKDKSLKQKQADKDTVKLINRIPGVNVKPKDLDTEADQPAPIHGFHPIKKALQPVIQLEKNSTELQKQIMRLEGPIAALQPSMNHLGKQMTSVEGKMASMQSTIASMDNQAKNTAGSMHLVIEKMDAVRGDLAQMREQISGLRSPIVALQQPLRELQGPLVRVSKPLSDLYGQLGELKRLMQLILVTIFFAAGAVAIGTPIAAVLVYRYRHKLFPDMKDHDFPVAKASDKHLTRV